MGITLRRVYSSTIPIVALTAMSLHATATEVVFWFDTIPIEVLESEQEALYDLEFRFSKQIDALEKTLRTTKNQLVAQEFERDVALEELLTEEQFKTLHRERHEEQRKSAAETSKFLRQFAYLSKRIADAEDLVFLEGLPRAGDDELQQIKENHETVDIDGWGFYKEPLKVSAPVSYKLRTTLTDYALFEPYGGGKFCGGFHPDFCVQWKVGDETYHALVCLTCAEILYVLPQGKATFDYSQEAWKTFALFSIQTFRHHKATIVKLDEMLGK